MTLTSIPQHYGESTTGRQSEWVLLQIWKNSPPWTRPEHLSTPPLTPPATPLSPTPAIQISEDGLSQIFRKQKMKKAPGPDSLYEILCWPAGPHLHKNLQQITGTVRSPFMLQTLHHHPHPKETQNYRNNWLQAYGSNVCGHEVIWKTGAGPPEGHHWTLAGSSSVYLQSKQVCGRCSQHGTALCSAKSRQTRGLCEDLFVDFSSAFNTMTERLSVNTIISNLLLPKLTQLSVPTSVSQWINSFLTDRQ